MLEGTIESDIPRLKKITPLPLTPVVKVWKTSKLENLLVTDWYFMLNIEQQLLLHHRELKPPPGFHNPPPELSFFSWDSITSHFLLADKCPKAKLKTRVDVQIAPILSMG